MAFHFRGVDCQQANAFGATIQGVAVNCAASGNLLVIDWDFGARK